MLKSLTFIAGSNIAIDELRLGHAGDPKKATKGIVTGLAIVQSTFEDLHKLLRPA